MLGGLWGEDTRAQSGWSLGTVEARLRAWGWGRLRPRRHQPCDASA